MSKNKNNSAKSTIAVCLIGAVVMMSVLAGLSSIEARTGIDANNKNTVRETGLVACWHFDENTGTTAYDSSGNNNNGTIYNASWTNGVNGSALSFDGVDDYVITDTAAFTLPDNLTISLWFKTNNTQQSSKCLAQFINEPNYANHGIRLGDFSSGTSITYMVYDGSTNFLSSEISPQANTWYHVAVTYSKNSEIKIFVNGELKGSTGIGYDDRLIDYYFVVGRYTSTTGYFNGTIDEVRIYNRALSASEIQAHYAETVSVFYDNFESYTNITDPNFTSTWVKKPYNVPSDAGAGSGVENASIELVNGNKMFFGNVSNTAWMAYSQIYDVPTVNVSNFVLEFSIINMSYSGGSYYREFHLGMDFRINGENCYRFWYRYTNAAPSEIRLMKVTDYRHYWLEDNYTVLDSTSWTPSFPESHNIRIECSGPNINVYIDGNSTPSLTATDYSYTSGYIGSYLRCGDGGGGVITVSRYLDDVYLYASAGNPPNPPTLVSPANNTWTNDNTPLFDWAFSDPDGDESGGYNVSIDDNINFGSINYYVNQSTTPNVTQWQFPENTSYSTISDGTWYWKVKANDTNGKWSDWSGWRIIKIDTVAPTSSVDVITPYWQTSSPLTITATASDINFTKQGLALDVGTGSDLDRAALWEPHVIKDGDVYKMWYGGSEGVGNRIFYANSSDGLTWTKQGMVLDRAGNWEDDVHGPSVIKDGTTYKMWYSGHDGGVYWGYNAIGYATSSDGITWTRSSSPVLTPSASGWDSYAIVYPIVIKDGTTYKMWYSGGGSLNEFKSIGYATSADGINWTKYSSNPVLTIGGSGSWDSNYVRSPVVIKDSDGTYRMWYEGSDGTTSKIGYAISSDSINWTKISMVLDLGTSGGYDSNRLMSPGAIRDADGLYKVWYIGYDGSYYRVLYAASMLVSSGVANMSLYYRYSADNATWGGWSLFGTDTVSPWSWSFNFPNGTGYYQFYSRARDNATNYESAPATADTICKYQPTGLTSHTPIYINGNSQFTSANGVTNGSGTAADPYIIENWDINASSAHGIYIANTNVSNVYFIIRNCVIHEGKSNYYYGIYFYNAINGKIDNVTSYNNSYGILLSSSSNNNTLTNCNVYNNSYYGIYLDSSSDNTITNCTVYNNSEDGIYLWYSSNDTITNCTISNSLSYDIYLTSSSSAIIINTTFNKTKVYFGDALSTLTVKYPLHVKVINSTSSPIQSATVRVQDNANGTFDQNYTTASDGWARWIECIEYWQNQTTKIYYTPHNVSANKTGYVINYASPEPNMNASKEITITLSASAGLTSHAPIYINGNSNFTAANGVSNPSAAGTAADPYIIEKWDINASSANGIKIDNANVYFIIRNCTIHDGKSNSKYGIYFYNVTNGKIDNVTSCDNLYGIFLYYSSNNIITNCSVYNNYYYGLYLYHSSNNNITNCTVHNNGSEFAWPCGGIILDSSSNNTITNCTIYSDDDFGINLQYSSNNNITNCIVYNNYYGIDMESSSNNHITNCSVYNNSGGIILSYSSNNQITNCTISNNSYNGTGAYSSNNNLLVNCTISNLGIYDLNIISNSDLVLINTTFTKTKVYIEASNLTVKYYLHVKVLNSTGSLISGVTVRIRDNANGTFDQNYTTGSDGWVRWIECTEYWQNQTTKIYYTPHNVSANKTGYVTNYSEVNMDSSKEITITLSTSAGLTTHAPIYINGNSNFTAANGVSNPGAAGTAADPYIIENWDINASSANGIKIDNTNVYFIIRNCTIRDGKSNSKYGIYFYNITNGKIDNVTSCDNSYGIFLYYSSNNNIITNCAVYNDYYYGLYLYHSSNNTITNCTVYNNDYGIFLYYSSNNNITNCSVYNNYYYGIELYSSSNNNQITNCAVYNNSNFGIYLLWSSNNQITNCTVYNNSYGIDLYLYCSNNNITNCSVYNNSGGIILSYSSNNNTVSACNIYNNSKNATGFWSSSNTTLINCTITNSGYYDFNLSSGSSVTIINTTFTKTKVYFDDSSSTLTVKYYLHVKVLNSTSNPISGATVRVRDNANGTFDQNYTTGSDGWARWIECTEYWQNQTTTIYYTPHNVGANKTGYVTNYSEPNMDASKEVTITLSAAGGLTTHAPIYINGNSQFTSANGVTSGNGTVSNPYIIENWDINASTAHGIYIKNTDVYFIIRNCTIHNGDGSYNGIYFYTIQNGKIDNITSYYNYFGIRLDYSSNNRITNCTVYGNSHSGIYLEYTSSNNNITDCIIHNNYQCGILLDSSSSNNQITNTTVYNNIYGFWLAYSSNSNTISNCTSYNNSYYGIGLYNSSNNLIYNNYFNNTNNAYSTGGTGNRWNITKTAGTNIINGSYLGGNYWSNYTGVDTNGDGLGDTPYSILGGSEQDNLPLCEVAVNNPPNPPTLTAPTNNTWINDSTPYFDWNFSDPDGGDTQGCFYVQISNVSTFSTVNYELNSSTNTSTYWQFPEGTGYTTISDGIWYWRVKTKDNNGAWSDWSGVWILKIDTTNPVPSFPANGVQGNWGTVVSGVYYTNSTWVVLKPYAYDSGTVTSGLWRFQVSNDGVNWYGSNAANIWTLGAYVNWTANGTTYNWNLSTEAVAGNYNKTVYFRIYDNASNYAITSKWIILDTLPPTSWITVLPGIAYNDTVMMNTTIFNVTWNGSDSYSGLNGSGINQFVVQYNYSDDGGITWTGWIWNNTVAAAGTSLFTGVNGRIYYFRCNATDRLGWKGNYSTLVKVIIDTTAPSIISTIPANNATNVSIGQSIIIQFSEEMNTSSIQYTCLPDPGGWSASWNTAHNQLTLTHNLFASNTTYMFNVTGKDLAGNSLGWYALTFTTGTGLSVVLSAPNGGEIWAGNTTHYINYTIAGGTAPYTVKLYYSTDSGSTWRFIAFDNRTVAGTFNYTWVTPAVDSTNCYVNVSVNDSATSSYDLSDNAFTIDSTPPTSHINLLPAYWNNTLFNTYFGCIFLNWTYSESTLPVTFKIYYRVGTTGTWTLLLNSSATCANFTSVVEGGTYYFYSVATDAAGNVETDYNLTIGDTHTTVDTTFPSSSANPISPYWQNSTPFNITATASDSLSGVGNVSLWYRYSTDNVSFGNWTFFGVGESSTKAQPPPSYTWSFTAPNGNGHYQFYSIAVDNAGNTESAATADALCGVNVTAPDTEKPLISNVQATPTSQIQGGYVNITCTVTDNVEVSVVKVNITGPADFIPMNITMAKILGTNSCYYNTTYSSTGTYSYYIWANDTSSNQNKSAIYQFEITLAPQPPTNLSITINNGANYTNSITVTLTLYAENATEMCFKNETGGMWSSWEPYGTSKTWTLESGADGIRTVYFKCRNSVGESTSTNDTIILDTINPVTTDNAPVGLQKPPVIINLTPVDPGSGVAHTYYKKWLMGTTEPTSYTAGTTVILDSDGKWYIKYYSVDNAGNAETAHTMAVWVDGTPPTTTDNAPAGWQNTTPITVTLTATDATSGVAHTYYKKWLSTGTEPAAWTEGTVITLDSEGVWNLWYFSVDVAENTENVTKKQVKIDTTPPLAPALKSPANNSLVNTSNIAFSWYGAYDLNGISHYEIQVDNNINFSSPEHSATPTSNSTSKTLSDGIYYWRVRAKDAAGNYGSWSAVWKFTVLTHNLPPEIVSYAPAINPAINETEIIKFSVNASDPNNDSLTYQWYVNGVVVQSGANSTFTFSSNYTSAGTWNITAIVSDGVLTSARTWTLTIINVNRAPVIQSYTPALNSTINETESKIFSVVVYDPDGNNITYSWYLNGTLLAETNDSYTFVTTYTSSGAYTITVAVRDNGIPVLYTNLTWTLFVSNVNVLPISNFTYSPSLPEVNGNIQFTDASYDPDGTIAARYWDFGDGNYSSAKNPVHAYSLSGTYTVRLTVTDSDGGSSTWAKDITVKSLTPNQPPVVTLTYPSDGSTVWGLITITGTASDADGTVQKVDVKIGDGSWQSATGTTAWTYIWDTGLYAGANHTISARAYDGTDYSVVSSVSVYVNIMPVANFTYIMGSKILQGAEINITLRVAGTKGAVINLTLKENNISIANLSVIRTSGQPNEASLYFLFNASSIYKLVVERVSGGGGSSVWVIINCTNWNITMNHMVFNQGEGAESSQTLNLTLILDYTTRAYGIVVFNGTQSKDPDGVIQQYLWSFGDGGSSANVVTYHQYLPGNYTAALTVIDNNNVTNIAYSNITILDVTELYVGYSRQRAARIDCPADLLVTNKTDPSRYVGYKEGILANNITGATAIVIGDIEIYLLPLTGDYTYNVSGTGAGAYTFKVYEPGDFEPGDFGPGDFEPGDFEPGDFEPGDFNGTVYTFSVPTTSTTEDVIEISADGSGIIIKSGEDKAYSLVIMSVQKEFVVKNITITGGATHTYNVTDWAGLETSSSAVTLAVDIDSDGISELTANTGTGVSGQEIWIHKTTKIDGRAITLSYQGICVVDIEPAYQPGAVPGDKICLGIFVKITSAGSISNLTITVGYSDFDIPRDTDESALKMYYWDASLNKWVLVEDSGVWVNNNTVWAKPEHLTIFAPMAEKVQEAPPPNWLIYSGIGAVIAITAVSLAAVAKRKRKREPEE